MEDKYRPAKPTTEEIRELRDGPSAVSLWEANEMLSRSRRIQWLENLDDEMWKRTWDTPDIEGVIVSLINYLQELNKKS